MSGTPPCYQLTVHVKPSFRDALIEEFLGTGFSDFMEGTVDFSLHPDADLSFDPNQYFAEGVDTGPITFFNEDRNYLESVINILSEFNKKYSWDLTWKCELFHDAQWRDSWKQSFKPLHFKNELVVYPPWENPQHFHEPYKLELNPGMAFGTGQHETTQLCLNLSLAHNLLNETASVLDVGTGSGILAMAAALYGCSPVLGIDIDSNSIEVAIENAKANHIADKLLFTTQPLQDLILNSYGRPENLYGLIFANIQFKPLVEMLDLLFKLLVNNGKIIFSGILYNEKDSFLNYVNLAGFQLIEVQKKNDWIGLLCTKIKINI